MPLFCFIFLVLNLRPVIAGDWQHYTMHNDIRDIAEYNETLWLAMPWGIRSVSPNGKTDYTPGNNGLEAADFVQIFALPDGDIIGASKDGVLVRKKGNNFETINRSFAEKKRQLLPALGKKAKNILILPFNTAISFFDYELKRSIITLERIGSNSLDEFNKIEHIAVLGDTIWLDLGEDRIWKRTVKWDKILEDISLADPYSWKKAESIPFNEESKPQCTKPECTEGNIPLNKVEVIAALQGKGAIAWGDFNANLSRKTENGFGTAFPASPYTDDPPYGYEPRWNKSLAAFGDGNFAVGFEGAGIYTYNASNNPRWYNAKNYCLTGIVEGDDNWPTVHGLVIAPDSSGYVFSFVGVNSYGLGFLSKDGNIQCSNIGNTKAAAAGTIIVRENSSGEWEIYVSWANDLHNLVYGFGGIDNYIIREKSTFAPEFVRRFSFDYGTPKDLSFDRNGNLWAVSSSRIFYKKADEYEWKTPYIKNFDGANLTSLEIDPQNNLWVGSESYGAFKISMENNSTDTLVAKRFRVKDGLMNEAVYDIAIDNVLGLVYFANEMGLSVYSTAEARNTDKYMEKSAPKVIAFPNPFRPAIHKNVIIDNINEFAELYIFNAAGRKVKFFKGKDLSGGRAIWDGTGENGKSVAPGVYHYFAVKGKDTAKGKILVER